LKYFFHPSAETEINQAVDYYNQCQSGLGREFAKEIHAVIKNILSYPDAWAPLSLNTRRCLTKRFPYGVIYQKTQQEVIIIAVMHLNRAPDYWRDRAKTY
jgi:hypothetical protein